MRETTSDIQQWIINTIIEDKGNCDCIAYNCEEYCILYPLCHNVIASTKVLYDKQVLSWAKKVKKNKYNLSDQIVFEVLL